MTAGRELCRVCGTACSLCGRCALVGVHLRHLRLLGRAPATTVYQRERLLARLGQFLEAMYGTTVSEATSGQLYEWRAALTVSDATAAGYTSHIKEWFRWLHEAGYRADDPSAGLPVPVVPRRLPRPIAEADLFAAVDSAPPRVRLMLVLAGWCGLRAKEIALLRREEIREREARPVLFVACSATKGRNERCVPLSRFVAAEIGKAGLPVSGWAFPRRDGGHGPLPPWMVSKLCNTHLREAGLADTLHSLRHRFATAAYAASGDVVAVQGLLGHLAISSTSGYVKADARAGASIVGALPSPRLRLVRGGQDDSRA